MSSFELEQFRAWKDHVRSQLLSLAKVATELKADSVCHDLKNTINEMEADTFRFVVVGEFTRGKSTVINALLGERLLPSSVSPTTAVLTRISSGTDKRFRVLYRDGQSSREISEAAFRQLIAPLEPAYDDRKGRKQFENDRAELLRIAAVEIEHPAQFLSECVQIVDTPGTNDLDPLREQITYD